MMLGSPSVAVPSEVSSNRTRDIDKATKSDRRSPVFDIVARGGGKPLDPRTRNNMEHALGADFSEVRIHTDSEASTSARAVQALAFTVGNNVVFQSGLFQPDTPTGQRLLAHELTHVMQQREGPVDGSPTNEGISVSDPSDRFERAADAMADRVMSPGGIETADIITKQSGHAANPTAVQRDGGVSEAAGLILGGLSLGQSVTQNKSGLSWTWEQATYPRDLPLADGLVHKEFPIAHFVSTGFFVDNDTTFMLIGDFNANVAQSPTMSSVYIELGPTSTYYASSLDFNARPMNTAYGPPEDPTIRISCTGRFDPVGQGDTQYRVVISVNRFGEVRIISKEILNGDGEITPMLPGFEMRVGPSNRRNLGPDVKVEPDTAPFVPDTSGTIGGGPPPPITQG
jgi:hypothetical protein